MDFKNTERILQNQETDFYFIRTKYGVDFENTERILQNQETYFYFIEI